MQTASNIHPAIRRYADTLSARRRLARAGGAYAQALASWGGALRSNQSLPMDGWLIYMILTGRGWGKTLTGAFHTLQRSETCPRIAIVAADFADGRDICVEGETGLKTLCPDLQFNRSIGEMTFPSGAKGKIFSSEDPESLRGPNNYFAWCDEFGKWKHQRATWEQLMFTMRKGTAQTLITSTPRPSPLQKELTQRASTIVVRGSSRENLDNLSAAYIENVIKPYEGTTLGRQEIEGQDIDDVPGALWTRDLIERNRVTNMPDLKRIVVAIDPAVTSEEESNETGLAVGGIGVDGHGYLLDSKGLIERPERWASEGIAFYRKYKADRIVGEANNGGDLIEATLRAVDKSVSYSKVYASRGKQTRAEPISALYERGLIHHVGTFPALEDQLCSWLPGMKSPDLLDSNVWLFTELMLPDGGAAPMQRQRNPFYGGR